MSAVQCSTEHWNTTQGLKCFISELPNVSLAEIKRYRGLHSRYQDRSWGEGTVHGLKTSFLKEYKTAPHLQCIEKKKKTVLRYTWMNPNLHIYQNSDNTTVIKHRKKADKKYLGTKSHVTKATLS